MIEYGYILGAREIVKIPLYSYVWLKIYIMLNSYWCQDCHTSQFIDPKPGQARPNVHQVQMHHTTLHISDCKPPD